MNSSRRLPRLVILPTVLTLVWFHLMYLVRVGNPSFQRSSLSGWMGFFCTFGYATCLALGWIHWTYKGTTPGIKNNGVMQDSTQRRGTVGWIAGVLMTLFYVILYWYGDVLSRWVALLDPLSQLLRASPADKWFLYGTIYTLAVIVMGYRMILRYRHNRYQLIRTGSVIFFQLVFAWLLPGLLRRFSQPEHYFTYFWPLKPDYFYPWKAKAMFSKGLLPQMMFIWGLLAITIVTPTLTFFFGKRWYCSWVCGCGGLAETAGDPWRHLSDKSTKAWRLERYLIHSVLVAVILTTALLWINSLSHGAILGRSSAIMKKSYGFFIGSVFSGVIGVGFYPLLGSRVWCRFGCPMAAILGLFQRFFSRFRITTNGGQCISCGNCSTYCEMGIDVRAYAQRGENIIRASCVGCGICAAVCPRGVLKLENGPFGDRFPNADRPLQALKDAFTGGDDRPTNA